MTILNELNKASFKGVIFYINDASTSGGRKTTAHEYPNTNRRYVEDLGKKGKTFSIKGYTKGDGSEYFANRDALINVLDEDGNGTLIHPFYGTLNVKSTTYLVDESVAELGRADFSIEFEHTDDKIFPFEALGSSKEKVQENIQAIQELVEDDITQNIKINSSNAVQDLLNQKLKVQNKFDSMVKGAINKTQNINLLSIAVKDYASKVSVGDIVKMAKATNGLFTEYKGAIAVSKSRFSALSKFFNFGEDEPVLALVTKERIIKQQNRDVLNSAIQVNATVAAYDSIYDINYKTVDEVQNVKEIISNQYQKIADSEIVLPEIKDILQDIHNETNTFFEETMLNTSRITEIETNQMPLTVLAYNYYDNLDKVDDLLNINKIKNPSFVEGSVKVLTNEQYNS